MVLITVVHRCFICNSQKLKTKMSTTFGQSTNRAISVLWTVGKKRNDVFIYMIEWTSFNTK